MVFFSFRLLLQISFDGATLALPHCIHTPVRGTSALGPVILRVVTLHAAR